MCLPVGTGEDWGGQRFVGGTHPPPALAENDANLAGRAKERQSSFASGLNYNNSLQNQMWRAKN